MKVLIAGASGLLGLNAVLALRERHAVAGAYLDHRFDVAGTRAARVDLGDAAAVEAWMAAEQPDVVLHAAGLTNVDQCEVDPGLAERLNVEAARTVARAAASCGARLLHVSTDHLYDGSRSMHTETDPISPVNVYAETKVRAEEAVRAAHPGAHVIRTNFYGWGHPRRQSFSDWVIGALRRGESLSMFDDVHFTPILVNDLIDVMMSLVERASPGTYNVAGGERTSKYAFGLAIAARFGLDASRIRAVPSRTFAFKAPRPSDMSLDSRRAAQIAGRPMPTVAEGLDRLFHLEAQGLPGQLTAAMRG